MCSEKYLYVCYILYLCGVIHDLYAYIIFVNISRHILSYSYYYKIIIKISTYIKCNIYIYYVLGFYRFIIRPIVWAWFIMIYRDDGSIRYLLFLLMAARRYPIYLLCYNTYYTLLYIFPAMAFPMFSIICTHI